MLEHGPNTAESLFVRGHCSTTGSESETVLYDDTSKADKHGGRSGMAAGDPYRAKALELLAQAEVAKDADTRGNFESLAAAFLRLASRLNAMKA
jgi:hypothetical protein